MQPTRFLAAAVAALLLAACATPTLAPPAPSGLPGQYSVSGRIGVNAAGKGYSASFSWAHVQEVDRVDVSNPLGQVVARLELEPCGARYYDSAGKARSADDIETLSERELGWRLPAYGLRYWLLGLADPSRPAQWRRELDERILEQDGWSIRFRGAEDGAPDRLTLSRPDLEVRIMLSDWQFDPPRP